MQNEQQQYQAESGTTGGGIGGSTTDFNSPWTYKPPPEYDNINIQEMMEKNEQLLKEWEDLMNSKEISEASYEHQLQIKNTLNKSFSVLARMADSQIRAMKNNQMKYNQAKQQSTEGHVQQVHHTTASHLPAAQTGTAPPSHIPAPPQTTSSLPIPPTSMPPSLHHQSSGHMVASQHGFQPPPKSSSERYHQGQSVGTPGALPGQRAFGLRPPLSQQTHEAQQSSNSNPESLDSENAIMMMLQRTKDQLIILPEDRRWAHCVDTALGVPDKDPRVYKALVELAMFCINTYNMPLAAQTQDANLRNKLRILATAMIYTVQNQVLSEAAGCSMAKTMLQRLKIDWDKDSLYEDMNRYIVPPTT